MNDPRNGPNNGPYRETGGTGHSYGNCLATLKKIYKDGYKYSGRNDNFDHKLGMFHDLCLKANVPPTTKNLVYSTMLRGPALDHYHTNLRHRAQTASLETLYSVTKKYFEGWKYQKVIINWWNNITLEAIIDTLENRGKTTSECLQLLLTEMRHLKLGLPEPLQVDQVFHTKLIQACQDLPACGYACCKPADDISGLIEELQASITTYERQQKRATDVLFTDY